MPVHVSQGQSYKKPPAMREQEPWAGSCDRRPLRPLRVADAGELSNAFFLGHEEARFEHRRGDD